MEQAASLETQKTLYDSLALHLVFWPIFTIWLPLFTAPTALFFVFRHWRTQMSILPRTRIRLWVALVLAVVEIIAVLGLAAIVIWFVPRMPRTAR